MNVVLLTSDTDCDGTSYGAHRIECPDNMSIRNSHTVLKWAQANDLMSSYYDCATEVLTLEAFKARYFPHMTRDEASYFMEEGYTNSHMRPNWNPWVYDDTIGIPALDTRYDD